MDDSIPYHQLISCIVSLLPNTVLTEKVVSLDKIGSRVVNLNDP